MAQASSSRETHLAAVTFSTSAYYLAHGHRPRGTGSWAFGFAGIVEFAPPHLSFTDAKKWAAKRAHELGIAGVVVAS